MKRVTAFVGSARKRNTHQAAAQFLSSASDGIVLATPNYSFQVSGLMKVFLDRLGFAFHRPRFHGKAFTSIVTQGIFGGGKVVKYLDFVEAGGSGHRIVREGPPNSSHDLPGPPGR
jgi:FMN-dependent NADH-azoreductase